MNKNEIYEAIRDSELVSDDIAGNIAEHLHLTKNNEEGLNREEVREGVIIPPKSSRKVVCIDNQQLDKLKQHNKELKERNDWFDNLVEYKVKGKYTSLKDYVESLEKRVAELEKALERIISMTVPFVKDVPTLVPKMKEIAEQALSKESKNTEKITVKEKSELLLMVKQGYSFAIIRKMFKCSDKMIRKHMEEFQQALSKNKVNLPRG